MLEYARDIIKQAEGSPQPLHQLRDQIGLDDFGELMISLPAAEFPNISRGLPRMASAQVQREWTGDHGLPLLKLSLSFVRSVSYQFARLTGRPLDGAPILDYGCGYGRIARLMYYFTDEVFGVDPWERSIDECRECGMGPNFLLSDYLPTSLPLARKDFALIFAFSVFTHLSERATRTALDVCRRYISDDGVLVITIRPVEYWDLDASVHGLHDTAKLKAAHRDTGFAFSHFNLPPVDGDITYGNTSMTIDWLRGNFPQWQVAFIDRSMDDAWQVYVFLRPA